VPGFAVVTEAQTLDELEVNIQEAIALHLEDENLEELVAGCLRSKRKPKTLAQMRTAIEREVSRRHDRGRY
jgi:hypothetical protein